LGPGEKYFWDEKNNQLDGLEINMGAPSDRLAWSTKWRLANASAAFGEACHP
jgi:hypothetical protein